MKLLYLQGIDFLCARLAGFSKERKDTQRAISRLIFHPHLRHYSDPDGEYISIPVSFMEDYLGCDRKTFNRINKLYGFFEVDTYWSEGTSRRMKYTGMSLSLIKEFYTGRESKKLMQATRRSGKITDSVARPRARNQIKVGRLMIYSVVQVDMEALKHYIDNASNGRKMLAACHVYGFSNTEQFGWGMYPQEFHKSNNGRVTGITSSLQNLDRDIREAALNGYYDYDVANCHFAILEQQGDFPTIKDYVDNTRERRKALTEELDVDYDTIKRCILAMLYGANRGKNEKKCAIASYLGSNKVDSFWNNPYIVDLYGECKSAAKELLGKDKLDFKELSFKLTKIEAEILEDVTDGTLIHVPMFDGFVSDVPFDCEELSSIILDKHGIKTRIKKRIIDYWGQFEKGA